MNYDICSNTGSDSVMLLPNLFQHLQGYLSNVMLLKLVTLLQVSSSCECRTTQLLKCVYSHLVVRQLEPTVYSQMREVVEIITEFVYGVWMERNQRVFKGKIPNMNLVLRTAVDRAFSRCLIDPKLQGVCDSIRSYPYVSILANVQLVLLLGVSGLVVLVTIYENCASWH